MATGDWHKIPNLISLFRGCIGIVLALLGMFGIVRLASGQTLLAIPLAWFQLLIVVGVISDKMDGVLARHFKWETPLGKVLERNMDGVFIVSAVVFETIYLRFPVFLLLLAALILTCGVTIILGTRLIYKKWFIDDYVSTKIAVGFAYLLLVLHATNFLFVYWFDLIAILVGIFALVDFLWHYYRWFRLQHTKKFTA